MKNSHWIGVAAAILLVFSCFMHWTWHPDLEKYFTGFFSQDNMYGRPGKAFVVMACIATLLFLIPKVWARRWNLIVNALTVAFAFRTFLVFSSCYAGICPEKQFGIWLMLGSSILMLLMALLPADLPEKQSKQDQSSQ